MQQSTLCSEHVIAGTIKDRSEDFVVDEIPLYEPCGSGEHVYLAVRKSNLSNDALIRTVANALDISTRAIGYAGRKDVCATTTQVLSVHLPSSDKQLPLDLGGVEILWQSRHGNKLRLGHLLGNRFTIRIRKVDPADVGLIQERMMRISAGGLPNAFGPQRFGKHKNNHHLGKALMLEDWDQLIHRLADGDVALARSVTSRRSSGAIAKPIRKLWVNALQSAIFNAVLQQRISDGTWNKPIVGDLVCKHGARGRTFEATDEDIDSTEFQSRVTAIEISPTGPLWGKKMRQPSSGIFEKELAVLHTFGLQQDDFSKTKQYGVGSRRPLRIPVENTRVCEGDDLHGSFVEARFELPAGSYATVLIESLLNVSL